MDKFSFFCLTNQDKSFLGQYVSPAGESSSLKQIPIAHLDRVKKLLKQLGYKGRIVYRGPRTNQVDPSFTRKSDAERFTVYPR